MHPALSVIFFTTASGAGYGLLVLLGLGKAFDVVPHKLSFGVATIVIALVLITTGLLSSTFHLGHPERAWRALSQWRSSWLSREGVLAIVTYIPILLFAYDWLLLESVDTAYVLAAILMSLFCLLTIYSTSMIYASLKTVHAWSNHWVPFAYVSLALMSGSILINAILLITGNYLALMSYSSLAFIVIALIIKLSYWRFIRQTQSLSTAETASGLGHLGKVSMVQSPHSQDNYLLKEMGYQIARKHADKLRRISVMCGFVIPFLLTIITLDGVNMLSLCSSVLALIFCLFGIIVERWLFFAEAKHTVMLYYGNTSA